MQALHVLIEGLLQEGRLLLHRLRSLLGGLVLQALVVLECKRLRSTLHSCLIGQLVLQFIQKLINFFVVV